METWGKLDDEFPWKGENAAPRQQLAYHTWRRTWRPYIQAKCSGGWSFGMWGKPWNPACETVKIPIESSLISNPAWFWWERNLFEKKLKKIVPVFSWISLKNLEGHAFFSADSYITDLFAGDGKDNQLKKAQRTKCFMEPTFNNRIGMYNIFV